MLWIWKLIIVIVILHFNCIIHIPADVIIPHSNCESSFYNLPKCIDQPTGYYCNCGPGFLWNSHLCIAAGVDSKMIFSSHNLSSTFVERAVIAPSFTISLWIRPFQPGVSHPNTTLLSHIVGGHSKLSISMIILNPITWRFIVEYNGVVRKLPAPIQMKQWYHVVWTQQPVPRNQVLWRIFVNKVRFIERISIIPVKMQGEFVLGQDRTNKKAGREKTGSMNKGFAGEIAHVNVWDYAMNELQIQLLRDDCTYNYCGNSIQWIHFRYGTRGSLRMKWPSELHPRKCKDTATLIRSCDSQCSQRIGARCKEEIKLNIIWERSPANQKLTKSCPQFRLDDSISIDVNLKGDNSSLAGSVLSNSSMSIKSILPNAMVTRYCRQINSSESKWDDPDYTDCLSNNIRDLYKYMKNLQYQANHCEFNESGMIKYGEVFLNTTKNMKLSNAIDLSLAIDSFEILLNLKNRQRLRCRIMKAADKQQLFQDHFRIIRLALEITSHLLSAPKTELAWGHTRPAGYEARRLLSILHSFYQQLAQQSIKLLNQYRYMPRELSGLFDHTKLVLKVSVEHFFQSRGFVFPAINNYVHSNKEKVTVAIDADSVRESDDPAVHRKPAYIVIISAVYRNISYWLPITRNVPDLKERTGMIQQKQQKINSDIVDILVSLDGQEVQNVKEGTLKIHFKYENNFNISNSQCVRIFGKLDDIDIYSSNHLKWKSSCRMLPNIDPDVSIRCSCDKLGIFGVASDMFNDLWNKNKQKRSLLAIPSYIGCIIALILCGGTVVMLSYMRTVSNTSAIHKNFSIAICAALLTYMFGIDKYDYKILCQAVSVLIHYFFLSCFAWLMNEAFNLYIVVTYAAHSHGDTTDGPMWRFHLLGWIMPAILVSTVFGINREKYYNKEMCWINDQDVWLFYGPAIAMIVVSILVLIFTAKEHHESSYTKNEKDNKAVINQTKAVWTQIVLQSLAWSFAFISINMHGLIVKCLYGLFNCLLGVFYLMFYYLFNDEVQKLHYNKLHNQSRSKQIRRQINIQTPTDSMDTTYHNLKSNRIQEEDEDEDEEEIMEERRTMEEEEEEGRNKRGLFLNILDKYTPLGKLARGRAERQLNRGNMRGQGGDSDFELITSL